MFSATYKYCAFDILDMLDASHVFGKKPVRMVKIPLVYLEFINLRKLSSSA